MTYGRRGGVNIVGVYRWYCFKGTPCFDGGQLLVTGSLLYDVFFFFFIVDVCSLVRRPESSTGRLVKCFGQPHESWTGFPSLMGSLFVLGSPKCDESTYYSLESLYYGSY